MTPYSRHFFNEGRVMFWISAGQLFGPKVIRANGQLTICLTQSYVALTSQSEVVFIMTVWPKHFSSLIPQFSK